MTGREFVGHTGRGHNAGSLVVPVAERGDEGGWVSLADVRSLFPPDGSAEIKGVLATKLRADEWVIFQSGPSSRPRARYRAIAPRRLLRFINASATPAPEGLRRLFVELGLESAQPGDCAVRIAGGAVVMVTLSRGNDGRFRAMGPGLSSLLLRRYDDAHLIQAPAVADGAVMYDLAASPDLGDAVDWSRDEELLGAALGVLSRGGVEASQQILSAVLGDRVDPLTGRVSILGGADPGELAALVRIGALADRLKAEGDALVGFREAMRADPVVQARIAQESIARADAERPAIVDMVRAEMTSEVESLRREMMAQAKVAVEELEAAELAALEDRVAARGTEIDDEVAEGLRLRLEEVEASVVETREALAAEVASLGERARSGREGLAFLEATEVLARSRLAEAEDRERDVIGRVEALSRVEADLSLRAASPAGVSRRWVLGSGERVLKLGDVADAAKAIGLLTPSGIDAIVRLAVYVAAGEVPVLSGDEAHDLVEVAASLLCAGRLATMFADPTMITFEDLWSRPGGGATPFAAASIYAAGDGSGPTFCLLSQAERSGARFWYPPLADACRRGALPERLMICATVVDQEADEAQFLHEAPFVIDARGAFDSQAGALSPAAFDGLKSAPTCLFRSPLLIDKARMFGLLNTLDTVPGPSAAMRLARVYAAARIAFGDDAAELVVADLARTAGVTTTSPTPNLKVIERTANA